MDKNKQRDIDAMIKWLEDEKEKLNQPLQVVTALSINEQKNNLPVLYSVFNGQEENLDEDVKKRYKKILSEKKALMAGVAGGMVGKAAINRVTGAVIGKTALRGMASGAGIGMMSPLGLMGPVGLALLGSGIAYNFVQKKAKSKEGKAASEKLENLYTSFQKGKENIQEKIQKNVQEMTELFEEYLPIALEKIKDTSEKVMIQLDDLTNLDQNKRIMQYQQIALNQYKEQQQMYGVLKKLQETQYKIMSENKELVLRLQKYEECGNYVCETNGLIE